MQDAIPVHVQRAAFDVYPIVIVPVVRPSQVPCRRTVGIALVEQIQLAYREYGLSYFTTIYKKRKL